MAQEKQITKKDIQQLLDDQAKVVLGGIEKKMDDRIDGLATIMLRSFQTNQEYMDKNFKAIGEEFGHVRYKLDKIDTKLDGQEKTIFNHDQKIDRLEVDFKLKKA